MTDQPDFEEFEQIPWAALAAKPADPRARYAAVAAAAVLLVGAGAWLTIGNKSPATTLPAVAAPLPASPQSSVEIAPVAPSPTSTTAVYSEADLMLIDVEDEERLAAMHAELLVRDLLTVDGDPVVAGRIADLLPNYERGETASYVEWASAFAVDSAEPGEYRVEVVYRVLRGGDDGFVRQPAGAMAVDLAVDVGGTARLLWAPEPIAVPVLEGVGELP
jgi:hypothetical protein